MSSPSAGAGAELLAWVFELWVGAGRPTLPYPWPGTQWGSQHSLHSSFLYSFWWGGLGQALTDTGTLGLAPFSHKLLSIQSGTDKC